VVEAIDSYYLNFSQFDIEFHRKEISTMLNRNQDIRERVNGALWGLQIGDALAMPVHWYYNRNKLIQDYGRVLDYLAPKNPHPDSILWRSRYTPTGPQGEILHDQARYWGQKGVHYHQFLIAGENTLNVRLCRLLIDMLNQNGAYAADEYLRRYVAFMTTPGMHRDTYIEECHRNFFSNYARGMPPERCGVEEKHIGGLPAMVPILGFYCLTPRQARQTALTHLALLHPGPKMRLAGELLADLLLAVIDGQPLEQAIFAEMQRSANPLIGHPFSKWLDQPDEWVVGSKFSTACYVEQSVPAVVYLALKYHSNPEMGLIANTNLGGDNAYRGAVLGALLGAENGPEGFPKKWRDGLLEPPPELKFDRK
jgi:ADP-ribosylglycohydrolase